ncbi:MAG: D-2-hydroxyacid dehydrogenase [Prevotella sp.]|jgi:glycerate dehydrogenase
MKIVVLDSYAANPGDLSWDGLKEFGDLTVYPRTSREDIVKRAKDAEIVLTNKVGFNEEIFSQLPKLKYLGVLATGFNIIDVVSARKHGVVVTNIPSYSTNSVAQMVFAHILNITNHVAHYADATRNGVWSSKPDFCYWDTPLPELAGKTLGIVGLGHIGSLVARIGHDFGMYISAYTSKNSSDLPEWIQKTTIDGIFSVSDILTLHCPLTDTTRNLVNKDSIAKMHPGAVIINTGRGPLVNEADVAEALESGHLAAYGADVMTSEPPAKDNPLLAQPNAFITPHVAWATFEARTRLRDIAIKNVKAFIEGNPINVVD